MSEAIDRINLRTMRDPAVVAHYARPWGLSLAEEATFARVAPLARGRRILDIGVGGGRTVEALRAISDDYLGIDYSADMVEACRRRFPAARFEFADARALDGIEDGSVGLAVFACNGIGMVSHADRLRILREVQRVLEPGGLFVFSTHNRNSPEFGRGFRLPSFQWSWHPLRAVVRGLRFCGELALRWRNRRHFRPFEVHTPDYAIINDQCHHYGTMLYYVTLAQQRRQLAEAGFEADAEAFDLTGTPIRGDSAHDSITLVARKPAPGRATVANTACPPQPVAG